MPAVSSRGRESTSKPRSDAYTGLLLLSLLAQVAGAVFLFLDYSRYPPGPPPKVPTLSASANPTAPPPACAGLRLAPRRLRPSKSHFHGTSYEPRPLRERGTCPRSLTVRGSLRVSVYAERDAIFLQRNAVWRRGSFWR